MYNTASEYSLGNLPLAYSYSAGTDVYGYLYYYPDGGYRGNITPRDDTHSFKTFPGMSKGAFVITEVVAVNQNSEQKGAAIAFINSYLSNEAALSNIQDGGFSISPSITQTGFDNIMNAIENSQDDVYSSFISQTVKYDFAELYNSLKSPAYIGFDTTEAFCYCTIRYCYDDLTLDEAVAGVRQRLREIEKGSYSQ